MMQEANNEVRNRIGRYITVALAVVGGGALLATFTIGVAASSSLGTSSSLEASTAALAASTPITLPSPCWRIGIITDGLHRFTYDTLDAAGVPVAGADPDDVHLLWHGNEVALQEVGEGDDAFESGESFLFYGQEFHGSVQAEKYTDEDVYWVLHVADSLSVGLAMPELLREPLTVADVGCGAGLPMLALAWANPELRLTGIEPRRRPAEFVRRQIEALGLTHCSVLARQAREAGRLPEHTGRYNVVLARAVGPAGKLIRDARRLLRAAPGARRGRPPGCGEVGGIVRASRRAGVRRRIRRTIAARATSPQ